MFEGPSRKNFHLPRIISGSRQMKFLLRSCRVSDDLCIGHLGMNSAAIEPVCRRETTGCDRRTSHDGFARHSYGEPTIGLDMELKLRLADLMERYRDRDCCVLLLPHDREFSSICADRIVRMSGGVLLKICRITTGNRYIRAYADWAGSF